MSAIENLDETMRETNDWRLTNQATYLKGVALVRRSYAAAHEGNDHDHCEFCFSKFMVDGLCGTLSAGYATLDGARWICEACYSDFADLFDWRLDSD
ncbi:MAG: hypothetical protein WAV95_17225 [Azonexus sp.]